MIDMDEIERHVKDFSLLRYGTGSPRFRAVLVADIESLIQEIERLRAENQKVLQDNDELARELAMQDN